MGCRSGVLGCRWGVLGAVGVRVGAAEPGAARGACGWVSPGVTGCHSRVPPAHPLCSAWSPGAAGGGSRGTGSTGTPRGAGDTEMGALGTRGGGIGDTGMRIRGRWDGSTGTARRKVLGTLGRDAGSTRHTRPRCPRCPHAPPGLPCASVSPAELSPPQPGGAGVSPPAPRPLRAPVTMPGVPLPFVLLILIPGGAAASFPRDLVARSTVGLAGERG